MRGMLRVVGKAVQAVLLALVAWSNLTALAGWRAPQPAPPGSRARRFRVLIPAHDEETVLGVLLGDLAAQDYPPELVRTVVVADRCTDRTVAVARAGGAEVVERRDGEPGKGPALAWALVADPAGDEEALVVLDADNRVPPEMLARFADELDAGHQVLQAYLDVVDPDGSPLAMASALTYWASNRSVQLARTNLGWPADLGGTGMCFTAPALQAVGGFGASATEDQELTARFALADIPVVWVHDVRVRDEKPDDLRVAIRQRSRWVAGKREVARRYAGALVRHSLDTRRPGSADLAVRLVQPGRSFVAGLSGLLAVASAVTRRGGGLWPWRVWAAVTALQVGLPPLFLARDGVPGRYIARYPLVTVFALLWLPVRILSRLGRGGWYHTPHRRTASTSPRGLKSGTGRPAGAPHRPPRGVPSLWR
jgi:hypothetical protein